MAFLEIQDLKKTYPAPNGKTVTVFEGVNFAVERGEFVCIIGHSGCGKTTILNVLAGLDGEPEIAENLARRRRPDGGKAFRQALDAERAHSTYRTRRASAASS